MWTITGFKQSDKGPMYSPTQSFSTKAEAVKAMQAQREPKTPITRQYHAYVFTAAK